MSGFDEQEVFLHLLDSTVQNSINNGFTILYEHPIHGIDKYIDKYVELVRKIDHKIEYISIDEYLIYIKEKYSKLNSSLFFNKEKNYIYFNNYNQDIFIHKLYKGKLLDEYYIPYENINEKDIKNLLYRYEFYNNNFKKEYESNGFIFLFFYFFKSIFMIFFELLKIRLKNGKQ